MAEKKVTKKSDGEEPLKTVSTLEHAKDESETPDVAAENVETERIKHFTERGQKYYLDQLSTNFRNLKRLSETLIDMVANKDSFESIKDRYSRWMSNYEQFLQSSSDYKHRLHVDEREQYIKCVYEEQDTFLRNFKSSIEKYFTAYEHGPREWSSKDNRDTDNEFDKRSRSSRHSSVSRSSEHSSQSSLLSNLSVKRLKEEQRKVELEARKLALKKKRELEIAKVSLKIQEEELELNTDIAVADAKSKVLDKFQQMELDRSESGSIFQDEIQHSLFSQPPEVKSDLNPYAKTFVCENYTQPQVTAQINHGSSGGKNELGSNMNSESTPDNINAPSSATKTVYVNNTDAVSPTKDAMQSVVQYLRKPAPEIKKFSGNALEYRKFVRQFHAKVVVNTDNDDEKMNYLEQFTVGEANKVVSGFSHLKGEKGYAAAMKQLEERYGDNEVIANAFIKKALEWPIIKIADPKSLDDFALFLVECENAAESIGAGGVLEYSENIKRLMSKLPFYLHDRWRNIVLRAKEEQKPVKFTDFVHFVKREAKKANDPTYGTTVVNGVQKSGVQKTSGNNFQGQKSNRSSGNQGRSSLATDVTCESPKRIPETKCSYCDVTSHTLDGCKSIMSLSLKDRYNHLRNHGICFGCLKIGHMSKKCKNRATCSLCKKRHPILLHDESRSVANESRSVANNEHVNLSPKNSKHEEDKHTGTSCATSSINSEDSFEHCDVSSAMAIIPVRVKLKNRSHSIQTYAFFDSGSSVSFCAESLMNQLGCSGKKMEITINTMGNPQKMNTYVLSGLQVCDLSMEHVIDLPKVYTKDELPITQSHIPKPNEIAKWPHLTGISITDIDADIGLMIGSNVPDAYTPFEIATGPNGSPHATRTRLGWIVWNVVRDYRSTLDVNQVQVQDTQLDQLVRQSINLDFPERTIDDKRENSVDDENFLQQVNQSIHFENGHYSIALPFRDQNMILPDNSMQGLQRLKSLKKKFVKNPKFKEDYVGFMDKLFSKGYAELVPSDQIDRNNGRVWYIPHHGIYHPKKPEKIRVVFDCSASYMGVSLNSQLLQGPDLANNLLGVLLRFREENVAVLGDIETMFYQVQVPPSDRDCLRFFWWPNGDFDKEPAVYRMCVHLFGAVSSPSCCNFALKRAIEENANKYDSTAVKSLRKDMYVDDYLASAPCDEKAIALVKDVTAICNDGGFRLTKWISSSPDVLASIPVENHANGLKQCNFDHDDSVERALGVCWFIEKDMFGFQINLNNQPATRRGILSMVSSIYDPLGIASPFVLTAKSVLQSLCKQKVGWDDEISGADLKRWRDWLSQLHDLETVTVRRCYKSSDSGFVSSCQLHAFADASDVGFGMVFYLRLVDDDGQIYCSFLLGKARVAPLKTITIPRMELTAAARAVKLCKVLVDELNYRIDKTFYWTDSMSVLRYIANENTRFHTFVANRLAIIHEATSVEQWRYVNTKQNPADFASRGMTISKFVDNPQWLRGPDFLWQPETEWPERVENRSIPNDDVEVKKIVNTASVSVLTCEPMDKLLSHFSDWTRMKRSGGWLLTAIDNLREVIKRKRRLMESVRTSEPDPMKLDKRIEEAVLKYRNDRWTGAPKRLKTSFLTPDVMRRSELALIRYVQHQHFENEFETSQVDPTTGRMVCKTGKSSKLHKLDPFIDDISGLLRVGGRLDKAELPYDAKHPIILPKASVISRLIIEDIHRSVGHLGKNAILAVLRQKYWVLGASTIIKSIVSRCVTCRKYQAPCLEQKMANLPSERLTPDEPPFIRVGLDYFGPFEVKRGRSMVKRYGVIFTCLATRAVHLEVAHSLDTDSCIDAIRRFIARRGVPTFVRSDNGTNLVGAEREMREEIQKWNSDRVHEFMLQKSIHWEFNPPSASHFGGVWERLIRSVRKVLYSVMHEQTIRLDDEGLHTLFCEVEAILNGRPISGVSDNVNDLKVLTPNHLLLLRPGEWFPPGTFSKTDCYVRRRWRQVQFLADLFWNRWVKEYLPLLQSRQKWFKNVKNIKVGDLVLVVENAPRNSWNLGRVLEVVPDKNGVVRVVKVKTSSSILTRPIAKLCLILESDMDS